MVQGAWCIVHVAICMVHDAMMTHREHGAPPLGESPVHPAKHLQDVGAQLHHPLVLGPEHVEVITVQCTVQVYSTAQLHHPLVLGPL